MKKIITAVVLIALSFGVNAQEKIQTEAGLKADFVYKNGFVGIGLISPAGKLDVRGNSAVYSDFSGYSGMTYNGILPNGKEPTFIISEQISGTLIPATAGQLTYKGGMSFGRGGSGIYSVNDNPAGSSHYGDIRFHTTSWANSKFYNADRMIITREGNVGVGTTTPEQKLHVKGVSITVNNTNDDSSVAFKNSASGAAWRVGRDYSNGEALTFAYSSNSYPSLTGHGLVTVSTTGNVGIGINSPDSKLSVNGKIHAKEVKVDLVGWPDFVFKSDYKLPTLKEVEKHINQKGHLANIPSAKDVVKNGVLLGEMNKKLLQKIEELTLYAIQQQKAIESENKKNKNLEKRIATLETLMKSKIE